MILINLVQLLLLDEMELKNKYRQSFYLSRFGLENVYYIPVCIFCGGDGEGEISFVLTRSSLNENVN